MRRETKLPRRLLRFTRRTGEHFQRSASMSQISRRTIVRGVGVASVAAAFTPRSTRAADAHEPQKPASSATAPKFKLGMISYMVGAKWDLPTLLKVCKNVGIA